MKEIPRIKEQELLKIKNKALLMIIQNTAKETRLTKSHF